MHPGRVADRTDQHPFADVARASVPVVPVILASRESPMPRNSRGGPPTSNPRAGCDNLVEILDQRTPAFKKVDANSGVQPGLRHEHHCHVSKDGRCWPRRFSSTERRPFSTVGFQRQLGIREPWLRFEYGPSISARSSRSNPRSHSSLTTACRLTATGGSDAGRFSKMVDGDWVVNEEVVEQDCLLCRKWSKTARRPTSAAFGDLIQSRFCVPLTYEEFERGSGDARSRLLGLAISNRGFSHASDRTGRSAVAPGISGSEEVQINDWSDLEVVRCTTMSGERSVCLRAGPLTARAPRTSVTSHQCAIGGDL